MSLFEILGPRRDNPRRIRIQEKYHLLVVDSLLGSEWDSEYERKSNLFCYNRLQAGNVPLAPSIGIVNGKRLLNTFIV